MDDGEHFCNICGGPLSTNFVQHSTYDPYLTSENGTYWLKLTRIVRANVHDGEDSDEEGAYYISMMGTYEYEPSRIFRTNLNGPENELEFAAWDEGFVVHNACFMMLLEMGMGDKHMTTMGREIFLRMQMRMPMSDGTVINWGDCYYGGAGPFQGHRWMALDGYEWLVTNPDYEPDFYELLEDARRDGPEEINAKLWDEAKSYQYVDPFWRFPVELRHEILHLLPSESLFDVQRASPAFCTASTSFSNKYWHSVIEDRMPWMEHTSLNKILAERESPMDYKSLAARLIEATVTSDDRNGSWDEYLGLQNRRRIMRCIDRILDDIEESVASKDNHEGVSTQILSLSSFRAVTVSWDVSIDKKNTDVYIRPLIDNPPHPKNAKVYFGADGDMVGMEFFLEGDKSGRLVGYQTNSLQSVSFQKDMLINGFVISLGPMHGNYHRPYAKLGHWSNNDLVHILCARTIETLVGFSAQYSEDHIAQFGIIVADLATASPGFVWDMEVDLLGTTRWIGNWPSPDNEPARLMPSPKQFSTRTQAPVQFLDFCSCIIDSIEAFFPFGQGKAIGGLLFKFSDGTQKLVGRAENHESISEFACNEVTFNPGNDQRITGVAINCTDKRLGHPEPCGINSIVFITEPKSNNMVLGYRRFRSSGGYDLLKGPYEYCDKERPTVGMQFVFDKGVITKLGLMH
ncbi:hypothetical protein BDV32DRAFT_158564 [Aspergillus pseudonomiae]|uniref:Uncharacterized protein n=1 Tax=Aspergillus pseudonomiae TaxID=1506151 RepID=A0A5N6I3Y7_9EURO|nr:uncharacterized protein BDV37DRAFT_296802 [Aspergillus pseudonomiae]KAB8260874.1 hypothetical protein BDV32DRAFT_158564 [Aspergillus pseudonomiae]KAE8400631.1 hypothetical protein BDV37DRAFT_296802 [Aspergillus pseudonomiae]